jgi:hypothetical protein
MNYGSKTRTKTRTLPGFRAVEFESDNARYRTRQPGDGRGGFAMSGWSKAPPRRTVRHARAPRFVRRPRPRGRLGGAVSGLGAREKPAGNRGRSRLSGASASPCEPRPPASPAPAAAKTRRRCATRSPSAGRAQGAQMCCYRPSGWTRCAASLACACAASSESSMATTKGSGRVGGEAGVGEAVSSPWSAIACCT